MTDCLLPSLFAAARSDDEGFVNIIVTVIIAAIWLFSSLAKAKKKPPSTPSKTADTHPMDEESNSGASQVPSGTYEYEEESSTFEAPEPQSDDTQESFPEPVTTPPPLPSLPGSFESTPMPTLAQASADTGAWESGIAFTGSVETESDSISPSTAGLWTHTGLDEGGDDPILIRLDPEQLRQAIVINEILAQPLSMRPSENG